MYIVRKEQRDSKKKFSSFTLEVRANFDISYPEIKIVRDSHNKDCTTIDYQEMNEIDHKK